MESVMAQIVEYQLDGGGSVLVAVDQASGAGVVTRGWGEDRPLRVAEQANQTSKPESAD
jgi:hypothetical protein